MASEAYRSRTGAAADAGLGCIAAVATAVTTAAAALGFGGCGAAGASLGGIAAAAAAAAGLGRCGAAGTDLGGVAASGGAAASGQRAVILLCAPRKAVYSFQRNRVLLSMPLAVQEATAALSPSPGRLSLLLPEAKKHSVLLLLPHHTQGIPSSRGS